MLSNNPIPIKFRNKKIIIGCIVYGIHNNSRNIDLVIDTGATISGISEDIAVGLGYDPSQPYSTQEFETAGGISELPTIIVSKINISGSEFENLEVVCNNNFDENNVDGLLGLDVLMCFDICINFTNNFIQLTKREDRIITP